MFDSKLIEQLQDENRFLRGLVKELQDRNLSLIKDAMFAYDRIQRAKELEKQPVAAPQYPDLMGAIQSMDAVNPEEKEQKELALQQAKEILGY